MASDAALVEAGRDALTLAKQLYEETEEWEAAKAVAQAPEVENWYYKRPPLSGIILAENVQPAYRHQGEDSPLLLRSVEDQMDDLGWRYANREETEAFLQTFQSQKSCPAL